MTAVPDWDIVSDADLVGAALSGDRMAFAGIYDRYADRLHGFCVGMVRDRDAAADCVQDVFCTAATALDKLREPDKLRPWLYAIARNEALRRIRQRRFDVRFARQAQQRKKHSSGHYEKMGCSHLWCVLAA